MTLYVQIEKKLDSFSLHTEFEISAERLALLGASGSGKSMTLKCIAGIEKPDRGKILLDGETLFDSERHIDLPPQQRRIGYLFQQYALFPTMTVGQNILCGIRSGTRAEKKQLLQKALHHFHLDGLERRLPSQLSGGEQQRVALARILCSQPRVILLDEPFSALDSFLRWELEQALSEMLSDFEGPVIWVTHDLGECRRNCSAVSVMENGLMGRVLSPEQLFLHPDSCSAARLVGCKNFFRIQPHNDGLYLPDWDFVLPGVQAPSGASVLAIPTSAICCAGNALNLRVCRVLDDVTQRIVLLRPCSAASDAPTLRVELPSEEAVECGALFSLSLNAHSLWFF